MESRHAPQSFPITLMRFMIGPHMSRTFSGCSTGYAGAFMPLGGRICRMPSKRCGMKANAFALLCPLRVAFRDACMPASYSHCNLPRLIMGMKVIDNEICFRQKQCKLAIFFSSRSKAIQQGVPLSSTTSYLFASSIFECSAPESGLGQVAHFDTPFIIWPADARRRCSLHLVHLKETSST